MKFSPLMLAVAMVFTGCTTIPNCKLPQSAPFRMHLSSGSAFYDSVEYINLEDNGHVSFEEPGKRKAIYVCLQEADWNKIRKLLDDHKAATWKSRYNESKIPSDGANHIVFEFSNLRVDTYDRMGSAPDELGITSVYNGIKSIITGRINQAEHALGVD